MKAVLKAQVKNKLTGQDEKVFYSDRFETAQF